MPFNSFNFWLIFSFIFGLYWLIPAKYNQARKVFLVLVSYLLYINCKLLFFIVLLGVTLTNYLGGKGPCPTVHHLVRTTYVTNMIYRCFISKRYLIFRIKYTIFQDRILLDDEGAILY